MSVERELLRWWHEFNRRYLHKRLRPPVIALMDASTRLGVWDRKHRQIRLSEALIRDHSWGVVLEVLKHEMAHQFVDEALGKAHEPPHGTTFRQVCDRLHIRPDATGLPLAPQMAPERDRMMRKIRGLLALAGSHEPHEAETAMRTAHRLMAKHHIDTVQDPDRAFHFRQIGSPKKRFQAHEKALASLLSAHFFVSSLFVTAWHNGDTARALEICGTPANLDTASYVYDFVNNAAERLWRAHKSSHAVASNRDRRRFLFGVVGGFHDKLSQQTADLEQAGLVLVTDPQLMAYTTGRHGRIRHTRRSVTVNASWEAGRSEGRKLVLHRPITKTTRRGRLLKAD